MIVLSHSIGTEMGQSNKKEKVYTQTDIDSYIKSSLSRPTPPYFRPAERNFVLDFSVSFHLIIILSDGFSFESNFDREKESQLVPCVRLRCCAGS